MSVRVSLTISAVVAATASFTLYNLYRKNSLVVEPGKPSRHLKRQNLPHDLASWRYSGNPLKCDEEWAQIWETLREALYERGYNLWGGVPGDYATKVGCTFELGPGKVPILKMGTSFGLQYVHPQRTGTGFDGPGTIVKLCRVQYTTGLYRAACTSYGMDVFIRVIAIGNEGRHQLDILRKIATGPDSFWSNNHTLPMIEEIQLEDIVLGVFPKVGGGMFEAFSFWPKNSVGDGLEMVMQMLEALEFIHKLNIAHRDAFRDNFVIQFQPESMQRKRISPTRPRVYLIDFEVAIQFPQEYNERQCFMSGLPIAGSLIEKNYSRQKAPECLTGELYSPFKLDIWQLGTSLQKFRTEIPPIDEVLERMTEPSSASRLGASETLENLAKIVHAMPPESLLFEIPESMDQ